jgi:hypothetical protein
MEAVHDRLYRVWSGRDGLHVDIIDRPGQSPRTFVAPTVSARGTIGATSQARLVATAILEDALGDGTEAHPGNTGAATGFRRDLANRLLVRIAEPDPWVIWRSDVLRWLDEAS